MSDPLGLIGQTGNVGGPSQVGQGAPRPPKAPGEIEGPGFKDVLMNQLEQVNRLQADAAKAIEDLNAGRRDDLAAVNMAKLKADTAFQMLLQVRNKMMEAYDEVKQIRV